MFNIQTKRAGLSPLDVFACMDVKQLIIFPTAFGIVVAQAVQLTHKPAYMLDCSAAINTGAFQPAFGVYDYNVSIVALQNYGAIIQIIYLRLRIFVLVKLPAVHHCNVL